MIRNFVFDMGQVLVAYDSAWVCEHFIADAALRRRVETAVFNSPEWVYLDMGTLPEEMALERMQARLDTGEERRLARLCFEHWHEYNMRTIGGMDEVLRSLKAEGYGIYLCSNASLRLLECYREYLPAVDCFDGILFSAEVKCVKPQREMYEHLFTRFSLKPQECFFIDDLAVNIEGARACGMDGYCHTPGRLDELRAAIEEAKRRA